MLTVKLGEQGGHSQQFSRIITVEDGKAVVLEEFTSYQVELDLSLVKSMKMVAQSLDCLARNGTIATVFALQIQE